MYNTQAMAKPIHLPYVRVDGYVLITGSANPKLADQIGTLLKKKVDCPISKFSDGEIRVQISSNLRRRHVFVIQPTSAPINDNLMELLFIIDAARRASAAEIVAIIPYFGYSRQDRKEKSRVPISASLVAQMIEEAGASRIITLDIHSEQQEGFVKIPWDNLFGSYSLIPKIKSKKLKNLIVASPDKGGMVRATGYAKLLKADGVALVYKERDIEVNNKSETLAMIGDVNGKDVLLVDDMIDTAGTIVNAANFLKKKNARQILVCSTHGIFSGPALLRIENSKIDEVIITDTIAPRKEVLENKKITIVSVAKLLAEAVHRIQTGESLSRDLIL